MNSSMTHYLAQFDCLHGEYSFTETVRFVTDGDPQAFLRAFVAPWYGDPDEDRDYVDPGIVSFNGGEIIIDGMFVIRAIDKAVFDAPDDAGIIHHAYLDTHLLLGHDEIGGAR